jgi:CubicO group peptidase (beta-lactamase class C family)
MISVLSLTISCNNFTDTHQSQPYRSELLDSLFHYAIAHHEAPAAALLVMHRDEPVYHKAFGWKSIEDNEKLERSDIFRIASMTKSFTAVGILQLVEKGKLKLTDPVSKYIPEYENPVILVEVLPDSSFTSKPAKHQITIQDLLTHTSGIGYGFQSEMYNALVVKHGITEGFEERPIETQENIRRIARLPLLHEPGEAFTYSLSFDVLGAVIEIVSGQKLDVYYREHIFYPLGMKDTYIYLPEEKKNRLVTPYEYNSSRTGFIPTTYEMTDYPISGAQTYMSGGADLSSTVDDLAIFARMLQHKGEYKGTRILSDSLVDMMTSKQSEHGWWNSDIGFGVSVLTDEGSKENTRPAGSFDFGGFWDTWCWIDRENELIGIIFLQMYPTNEYNLGSRFQDLTYQMIESEKH